MNEMDKLVAMIEFEKVFNLDDLTDYSPMALDRLIEAEVLALVTDEGEMWEATALVPVSYLGKLKALGLVEEVAMFDDAESFPKPGDRYWRWTPGTYYGNKPAFNSMNARTF